jgi:hypothetical protein
VTWLGGSLLGVANEDPAQIWQVDTATGEQQVGGVHARPSLEQAKS